MLYDHHLCAFTIESWSTCLTNYGDWFTVVLFQLPFKAACSVFISIFYSFYSWIMVLYWSGSDLIRKTYLYKICDGLYHLPPCRVLDQSILTWYPLFPAFEPEPRLHFAFQFLLQIIHVLFYLNISVFCWWLVWGFSEDVGLIHNGWTESAALSFWWRFVWA